MSKHTRPQISVVEVVEGNHKSVFAQFIRDGDVVVLEVSVNLIKQCEQLVLGDEEGGFAAVVVIRPNVVATKMSVTES